MVAKEIGFGCSFFLQPFARIPTGQSEGPGGIILDLLIQKMFNVCSMEGTVLDAGGGEQREVSEKRDE